MVIFYSLLFQYALSSPPSLENLFKEQAKDYKEHKLSKVMARGHYYRHKFLRNPLEIKAAFSPNMFKFEIFALAQNCQWTLVDKLVSQFAQNEKIQTGHNSESQELNVRIEKFKTYKMVSKELAPKEMITQKATITVAKVDWSQIEDYQSVAIEVEDLCQK